MIRPRRDTGAVNSIATSASLNASAERSVPSNQTAPRIRMRPSGAIASAAAPRKKFAPLGPRRLCRKNTIQKYPRPMTIAIAYRGFFTRRTCDRIRFCQLVRIRYAKAPVTRRRPGRRRP